MYYVPAVAAVATVVTLLNVVEDIVVVGGSLRKWTA